MVGLSTNLIGYLGYLLLTHLGLGHTTAMSSLYLLALTLSFVFNRKWTFGFKGDMTHSIFRYLVAHLIGYFFNLGILFVMVDIFGYPHQVIQAIAIFVVAGLLFILFRYFVFNEYKDYRYGR